MQQQRRQKWPDYKPASGMPASGMPASGMKASGWPSFPGWGGPAGPNPRKGMNKAEKEARAARMLDIIGNLAESSEHDMVKLSAANSFLDRVEGKPVQVNINGNAGDVTISDDQRRAALDAMRSRPTIEGRTVKGIAPPKPSDDGDGPI